MQNHYLQLVSEETGRLARLLSLIHICGGGLGLNICKVLVNLSGGQIRVESQQGECCLLYTSLTSCR